MIHCVRSTLQHDGPRGFFRGLAFPLCAVGALNSIFFGVYGNLIKVQTALRQGDKNALPFYGDIFLAGSIAGAIQAVPAVPIELVKVKLQSQTNKGKKSLNSISCKHKLYLPYTLLHLGRIMSPKHSDIESIVTSAPYTHSSAVTINNIVVD